MRDSNDNHDAPATILIVDDEPEIASIFSEVLSAEGHHTLAATSPARALEIARNAEGGIDLLLTDVMMPEMNGVDLARRIRLDRPGIGVLFISGHIDSAIELPNGSRLLPKPISIARLCEAVWSMLPARPNDGCRRTFTG